MKTWDEKAGKPIETPEKQIKFFEEIESICKKYDLSISHEDAFGAFIIEKYCYDNMDWLKAAHVNWT